MSYTVTKLITNAYYLSGKVAPDLETVSGPDFARGFEMLNKVLADKFADVRLIPYYSLLTIDTIPGQETYYVPRLVSLSSCTFNIGTVRYPMTNLGRVDYFATARVDNINSLPVTYHAERVLGGTNIFLYFLPAQNYPLNIVGKFALLNLTPEEAEIDLLLTYDYDYISYLEYSLSSYICQFFGISLPANIQNQLWQYEAKLRDLSPIDLTIQKRTTMGGSGGWNWGDVNIGRGYRPTSG